jgi:hypothetical protein
MLDSRGAPSGRTAAFAGALTLAALGAAGLSEGGRNAGAGSVDTTVPLEVDTDTLRIIEEKTVLAAVVHTEGIGARFAPDHLFHATRYEARLRLDPERPEEASFRARIWAPELGIHDPTIEARLEDRLLELDILDEPYDEVSDDDRERIWAAMVGRGQLYAEEYPWIEVETLEIREDDDGDFPWTVQVALTMRGTRTEAPLAARLEQEGDRVRVEAYGAFHFTDVGIEPYRTFLGAVRNRDEFHLYLDLRAEPPGP